MRRIWLALAALTAFACGAAVSGQKAQVDYPTGYRGWQHTTSLPAGQL